MSDQRITFKRDGILCVLLVRVNTNLDRITEYATPADLRAAGWVPKDEVEQNVMEQGQQ